ncbi:MAG: hypothetical protein R6V53_06360 [Candidatus Woesearchaeota archaeon]
MFYCLMFRYVCYLADVDSAGHNPLEAFFNVTWGHPAIKGCETKFSGVYILVTVHVNTHV